MDTFANRATDGVHEHVTFLCACHNFSVGVAKWSADALPRDTPLWTAFALGQLLAGLKPQHHYEPRWQ